MISEFVFTLLKGHSSCCCFLVMSDLSRSILKTIMLIIYLIIYKVNVNNSRMSRMVETRTVMEQTQVNVNHSVMVQMVAVLTENLAEATDVGSEENLVTIERSVGPVDPSNSQGTLGVVVNGSSLQR